MSYHSGDYRDDHWPPTLFHDLPEPPTYDEFEFSFPSELSPSLFTLADGQDTLLSPESLSFPSFSAAPSPVTWNNFSLNNERPAPHMQQGPPSPGADAVQDGQEQEKEESKLFKAEEKNALDAFFSETLAKPPSIASMKRDSPDEEVIEDSPSEAPTANPEEQAITKSEPVYQVKSRAKRARPNPGASASTSHVAVDIETGPVKRSAHIASEQKRRTTIKENYKALVDLLLAGEEISGIQLSGGGLADDDLEDAGNGKKKGSKPKGRGRGRKGQDGAGATKSVVLERAADYLRWLERSNSELEREVTRLEGVLAV